MLAGVLLAGVAPAGGIYRAFHPRAGGQWRIQAVPDHAVRNLYILHRRAAQKAGVGRLAAALGVEGGFIQRGPPALAGRLTGQHGGRKGQRRGIGFVQFHGGLHQGGLLAGKINVQADYTTKPLWKKGAESGIMNLSVSCLRRPGGKGNVLPPD